MRKYNVGEKAWWVVTGRHRTFCSDTVTEFFGSFKELLKQLQEARECVVKRCRDCGTVHDLDSVKALGLDGEKIHLTSAQMNRIRALFDQAKHLAR